ncbi:Thioredoxin domain-containing protein 9 [Acropora cervicornis]|uniref:Thioredoxin domain-containing protein 9 n=1 Tax=Acropora cervicornis TaxID=6130 RepID=A0AAD9QV42_ACRCE|nr:Thioredoxin domain-containing protein 9 [Acropora cervicornis]
MAGNLEQHIQNTVLQAAKVVEDQVDSELDRLERMTTDEMEELREKRMEQLKKYEQQKREWLHKGHGQYNEVPGDKEFFAETRDSPRLVCHFYRDSTFRCKIVDKHLTILAPKHVETKFLKVNAERCHFLIEKLNVRVLPTILLVKDGKFVDRIIGFDDLGGHDEFSTEMMEWRIARCGVINYSGDLSVPPGQATKKSKSTILKKSIRSRRDLDDDDDSEDSDED